MKKFVVSLFILSLAFVLLACTDEKATTKEDVVFGEDDLTFSFYGHYDWMTTDPWAENEATKWIKENLKVTVKPIQSGGKAVQKLNSMIASTNLPDVIHLNRGPDVQRLIEAEQLVPLDDYIEKYPNIKKWVGDQTLNMLRSEDGHIYQIPNWYSTQPRGNGGWMINKQIYSELGSPKLETYADLYAYLQQVKEKYPDVVPLEVGEGGQGIEMMYTGFGEDLSRTFIGNRAYPDGDKLKSIFEDPTFKETMIYANKLFKEKLITQDAMTQTMDQVKEKINTGKVAVVFTASTADLGRVGNNSLKAEDPEAGYDMIWPIHKEGVDKNKVWIDDYVTLGWNVNVITKNADNPEAIFAYFDWVVGEEGQKVLFFGPKGLYWDEVDANGYPVPNEKYLTDSAEVRGDTMIKFEKFNWAGNTVFIDNAKSEIEYMRPKEERDWTTVAQNEITWKTAKDVTEFTNLSPLPESEEGIIAQRITDIFDETFAKILFAKGEAEVSDLIEQAGKDAKDVGQDKLLKFQTKKWHENLDKIKQ